MYPTTMIKALAAVVLAASPALAELAVTLPITGTTCTGGQACQVTWQDNRNNITMLSQGNCTVALYIGNAQQQTFLQPIAYPNSINVSEVSSLQFTVDPAVGANNDQYFIRFSSITLKNPAAPTQPYLSFSAKFSLTGMSGTFNSTVQQQLAGVSSSGGIFTSTATGTSGAVTTAATTTRASTTSSRPNAGFHSASAGAAGVLVAGAAFVVALF